MQQEASVHFLTEVERLKVKAENNRQHIQGNGGLGLLRRVSLLEDALKQCVLREDCKVLRQTEFKVVEGEVRGVKNDVGEIKNELLGNKRINIMLLGIILTSLLSLASFVLTLITGA